MLALPDIAVQFKFIHETKESAAYLLLPVIKLYLKFIHKRAL